MNSLIKLASWGAIALMVVPAWAEEVEITRTVGTDSTVEVSNVAGEIIISARDTSEVILRATLGRDQEVVVHESSSGVRFEVRNMEDDDDYDEAELVLEVPLDANIVAEGVSADISVSGARGQSVTVESVSGDVEVTAEVGLVELSSVSGDVEFEGRADRGSFESVSGDIEASGVSGEVSISTVSGDASLDAGVLDRARFETVSGTLELSLSLAAGGRLTAEAMSGDVLLSLPADQEGEFDVQTFSGDIRSAFGSAEDAGFGPGSSLKQVVGSSGAQFRIENFSGDVRIEN